MTMVALSMSGNFEYCKTFNHERSLVYLIEGLQVTDPKLTNLWEDLFKYASDLKVKRSIKRLLQKGGIQYNLRTKLVRCFAKIWRSFVKLISS